MRTMVFAVGLLTVSASAAEYYVNHETGDDQADGSIAHPFQTFARAREALRGGDTLHVQPTKTPYTEKFGELPLKSKGGRVDGTPERPTVVDAHGATFTTMKRYPSEAWKDLGGGVWRTCPRHNVVVMGAAGYYNAFPFIKVAVDGGWKWIQPVRTRELMKDFEMYWCFKYDKTEKGQVKNADFGNLYLRLPAGMTPDTNEIHLPQPNNFTIGADWCVLKNANFLWSTADCIDSHRTKGSVVENVSVEWCLDQCISAHSTADMEVRYSYFAHALAGNVLDVSLGPNEPAHVKYYGCVFGEGTGVKFKGQGTNCCYEVDSCVIRDQNREAVGAGPMTKVAVRNVVVAGCRFAVGVDADATLLAEDCDFTGVKDICSVWSKVYRPGNLTFRRCAFKKGQKVFLNAKELTPEAAQAAGIVFENCSFDGAKSGIGSSLAGKMLPEKWTTELLCRALEK